MNLTKSLTTLKILLSGAFVLVGLLGLSSISLAQGPWTTKTGMPTSRFGLSASVVNDKIYAIGGTVGWPKTALSVNEEYDPSVNTDVNKEVINSASFMLHQNYPNPFKSETMIEYEVLQSSQVTLTIYNSLGQIVRTLVDDYKPTGQYSVAWDGKDKYGQIVPPGNYYYQIKMDGIALTKKITFVK